MPRLAGLCMPPCLRLAGMTEALMPRHRAVIAREHRGRGREVLSLDWTYAHHERGPKIWGINKAWDHVEKRDGRCIRRW